MHTHTHRWTRLQTRSLCGPARPQIFTRLPTKTSRGCFALLTAAPFVCKSKIESVNRWRCDKVYLCRLELFLLPSSLSVLQTEVDRPSWMRALQGLQKKNNAAITVNHVSVGIIVHRLEYYTFAFGYSRIKRVEIQCFCFYLPLSSLVRIVRASV